MMSIRDDDQVCVAPIRAATPLTRTAWRMRLLIRCLIKRCQVDGRAEIAQRRDEKSVHNDDKRRKNQIDEPVNEGSTLLSRKK
jgi:hypothetical protein